jgi:glyoxylase-like metal-dependent hydrolase (beta-lactamase superfamily II)
MKSNLPNVAPGVTTITLPMPWELETVNVHLIELDEGVLLIDSGIATTECFDALESSLGHHGVAWRDVKMLCLTHLHPDHIGLSWKILDLTGAQLVMHRVELEYLALVARENRAPFFDTAMQNAGVPDEMQSRMDHAMRDVRRQYRPHQPHSIFEGGERIPVRGGSLQAIWTPGHSPGHLCLYSPEHRYLISGDHLLENITPNIGWHPGHDMLAQYLSSLDLLTPYDVDLVIPSHGAPFRDHRRRIRETTDHHAERCGEILKHISVEPRTANRLVELVWPRKLSAFHHHFAVFEILAHLEYMSRRGEIVSQARNGGALYWEVAN